MKSSKDLKTGEMITFKKPHPCGSNKWQLIKAGSEMELRCSGCGRKIVLSRKEFEKKYKNRQ